MALNPVKGLKRIEARRKIEIVNSGYSNHGASKTKKSLLGWISKGGSPKEDIDDNLLTLRERSRDLYMGAPLATGALKTMRTNIVGSGLKVKPTIDYKTLGMSEEDAAKWIETTEKEFKLWSESKDCDAQRMNDFYELQQLAFLSWIMSGDCFVLLPFIERPMMPYDLRIWIIEADRVCNPDRPDDKIVSGVEVGNYGEVIAYHVCNQHPLAKSTGKKEWKRIEKYGKETGRPNVLHLMESERPEQLRGIPILAPVIEELKQLSRYTEAELMAAVVSGMFTVFIESQDEDDGENMLGQMVDEDDSIDEIDDDYEIELGNGAIVQLNKGDKANAINPGRPNTAFDGFVTSITRQIGVALELPYEVLIKHFQSSYSASRGALLEAWKMFRMRRSWLANDFCQPIYEEWLAEAVALGRIEANGFFSDPITRKAYCSAQWNGPSQGQLDPKKEVDAAILRVNNGFSTRSREAQELTGTDFVQNAELIARENELLKEAGIDYLAKGGENNEGEKDQDE